MNTNEELAYCFSYDDSQSILNALPGSRENDFYKNIWRFEISASESLELDFTIFLQFKNWYLKEIETTEADFIKVAKQAWLDLACECSAQNWSRKFRGLALFFSAVSTLGIRKLTRNNLSEFLSFLLNHAWVKSRHERLNYPISYASFTAQFDFETLRQSFSSFKIDLISPSINSYRVYDECNTLIPRLTDNNLTSRDWRTGTALDRLTLDHGQYYIEYCMNFFQNHFATSVAVLSVIKNVARFTKIVDWNEQTTHRFVMLFLDGYTTDEACREMSHGKNIHSFMKIEYLRFYLTECFEKAYLRASFISYVLTDAAIETLLHELMIEASPTHIDRFRVIIWGWLNDKNNIETGQLLASSNPPVNLGRFESALQTMKTRHDHIGCKLPTTQFYSEIGLSKAREDLDSTDRPCRNLIRLTEFCGLTTILALTGWRASELGFPISALQKFDNDDVLDQYAFPFRYQIEWYVYKTHGRVPEKREITSNIATLINLMNILIGNGSDEPCLYRFQKSRRDIFDSTNAIKNAVRVPWATYVENYPGFKEIADIESWQAINKSDNLISSVELQAERGRLLSLRSAEEWEQLKVNSAMRATWIRSRDELPLLKFHFANPLSTEKANWLARYKDRTLNTEWLDVLDARLSQDTRDWISTMSRDSDKGATITKRVTFELMRDCLYPTPHAFRHMWAEAIYRRFDGDAGWMIRSQFKHISKKMWLAYIRDKDNRNEFELVKRQVISSVVNNYMLKKGENYAGQMHTFFRRLMKQTSILSPEEQADFVERIATVEIVDIKPNPWGYCLLKQRTIRKARCAEMGEPQRHNASPSLCLECPHNLVQSSNVDWILFHIHTHVAALQNPIVPSIFKTPSYKLVKDVTKHVAIVDPTHESLIELRNTLNVYESGINL